MTVTMRCPTCGRFRAYDADDHYCLVCGGTPLDAACTCGRNFDYVLLEAEHGELHCPRCGTRVRGRAADYD